MTMALEKAFDGAMMEIYNRAKSEAGYTATARSVDDTLPFT